MDAQLFDHFLNFFYSFLTGLILILIISSDENNVQQTFKTIQKIEKNMFGIKKYLNKYLALLP